MPVEKTIQELFDKLKEEMDFLPPIDHVRDGFLFGFTYQLFL